jgi:undecaprenyl diphosphate synthase
MPCYWPDFDGRKLVEAIEIFSARDRRFGGLTPQDVAL